MRMSHTKGNGQVVVATENEQLKEVKTIAGQQRLKKTKGNKK